jgi:protocadherin Fat 1/2/3
LKCIKYLLYIYYILNIHISFLFIYLTFNHCFPFIQAGVKAVCHVVVHILDRNDNAPVFLQPVYRGWVSEAAPIASLVLANHSTPLVISAHDKDSQLNSLLQYDIVEPAPRRMFHIDSTTGKLLC